MNIDRAVELQTQAWSLQAEGNLDEAAKAVRQALWLLEESGEAPTYSTISPISKMNARTSRTLCCWQNRRIRLKIS